MRVLLINSPSTYAAFVTTDWDRTAEDIGAFPPIGLSYIAGYLVEKTHHEVAILDAVAEKLNYDQIRKRILEYQPDIAGTSVFTQTFFDHLKLAKTVKEACPKCFFCVGGVQHVKMFLEETLRHPEIDFVVRGEGEVVFSKLLDALERKTPLSDVSGLSMRQNGQVVSFGEEGYINDINQLPSPAFHLLPIDKYRSAIGTGKPVGTITSSRGCPYHCTFCDHPYRSYREVCNEKIISEMQYFYDQGIREYVFFDDMFNIRPKRVMEISEAIIERFPGIIWSFRGRADQVTEEMVASAKAAGCFQMMFGIEAANDNHLKEIRKNITTQQFLNSIAICKKHKIETSTNWIIGLPCHKSRQDILDLLDFAIHSGTDYTQFNILIPYAGTEIYEEGVRRNVLPLRFWNDYVLNPTPNAYIPVWDEFLSREELSELLKYCYRKFYFRPANIVKNVLRLKNYSHFRNKLKGMLTLLGFGGFNRKK